MVAVDESENSRKALTFSAELSSKVSSELLILTVIQPLSSTLLRRGGGRGGLGERGGGGGIARAKAVAERLDAVQDEIDEKHQKTLHAGLSLNSINH